MAIYGTRYLQSPRLTGAIIISVLWSVLLAAPLAHGNPAHHPGRAGPDSLGSGGGKATKGGGKMGGKEGGMGGMMEKMGAPKPRELYPKLMDLPDLPMEERIQIKAEAHQRMVSSKALLMEGLTELSNAEVREDYSAMRTAAVRMREGLAQFESGLAAHQAIAEGKAPRNIAMQWFKREMNLFSPTDVDPGFRLIGMSTFHSSVMVVLVIFSAAMFWMYFHKMKRAAGLLEKLISAEPSPAVTAVESVADPPDATREIQGDTGPIKCRLQVAGTFQETSDARTFRFVDGSGGPLPFNYRPGQFLTLTLPIDGKPVRRSYTISSSPTQGYYCEITVKREDRGIGSRYLHDTVKEGDILEVQGPGGRFTFTGKEADSIVLIAGGVGITPMMSITRALTDIGWKGDIDFIIACRDLEHFIFESELKTLRKRHPNLHLHVAMSRIEKDIDGYHSGRLSKDYLGDRVPDIASKQVYLCGASPMMESTKKMLAELHVPASNIHFESFGAQKPPAKAPGGEDVKATAPGGATVNFGLSKKSTEFLPDETILEASERVDVEIENSCREGICGMCAVKLLSGEVEMDVEDGLGPEDKASGLILACQAKAKDDITVEA